MDCMKQGKKRQAPRRRQTPADCAGRPSLNRVRMRTQEPASESGGGDVCGSRRYGPAAVRALLPASAWQTKVAQDQFLQLFGAQSWETIVMPVKLQLDRRQGSVAIRVLQ